MKQIIISIYFLLSLVLAVGQVTLTADYTSEGNRRDTIHNMWTVANRISPATGGIVRSGMNINAVRMLGGILKTVDGKKVPDYNYDPCYYDSASNTYVYNWAPLKSRINSQLNSDYNFFQFVVDQPPWAFQHDYSFIPEGTRDSIHFRENERQSIYGNSLPPSDPIAFHEFIKAMMEELISTYGRSVVEQWRFRIGSEIETPEHWYGSKQDFIDHFANTVSAIREVLPTAKVGLHTREPGFIYKNGTVLNYKGEPITSFVQDLIEYCYDNDITYNFWGISEYVLINSTTDRDISKKYEELLAPFVENPKWNNEATIDIMEYSVVTDMNPPDGGGLLTVGTSHSGAFDVVLADMFYSNDTLGLNQVYRWGQRPNSTDPPSIELLTSMEGKIRYLNNRSGSPAVLGNIINAIFCKSAASHDYDVLAFNYNVGSLEYKDDEDVAIVIKSQLPVGSLVSYRNMVCGEDQNELQNFLKNEPADGWVKDGWDWKGSPPRTLNEAGLQAWQAYSNPNPCRWSAWKFQTTQNRTDGGEGSEIRIETNLSSFSLEKIEIRYDPDFVEALKPPKIRWTSNEDFEQFTGYQMITSIRDSLFILNISGKYPSIIYNQPFEADLCDKIRIVVKNETLSDIFWFAWYINGIKYQKRFEPTPSVSDTSFHEYYVDLGSSSSWKGIVDYFTLETANKADSGMVTIDTIEFILKANVSIHNVNINTVGDGYTTPSSGTCYTGQEIVISAIPFEGYQFDSWTGDTISSDNPLLFTIKNDLNLTAHFSSLPKQYILTTTAINGMIERTPDLVIFEEGDTVWLNAIPDEGFEFKYWSGDVSDTLANIFIVMNSDMQMNANFISLPERFTLSTFAFNGIVERDPDLNLYTEGDTVWLTAVPNDGFEFSAWSGYLTDTINHVFVVMNADIDLTAIFAPLVGVSPDIREKNIEIYPNPATGRFNMRIKEGHIASYRIINEMGKKIESGNFVRDTDIKISQPGTYIIQLMVEDTELIRTLIIF